MSAVSSRPATAREERESWDYNAFISYSHAADGLLAPALQKGLQRLAKRWNQRRALRIFRDKSDLSVRTDLWGAVESGLKRSEFFILLASPEAAASDWVNKEISLWVELGRQDRLLSVVTDGGWEWDGEAGEFNWAASSAAPRSLDGVYTSEPLYLDLRWAKGKVPKGKLNLRNSEFRSAVVDLAATIHRRDKDELEGQDLREFRFAQRLRRVGAAVLLVLAAALGVAAMLATSSAGEARRQRSLAEENEAQALENEARAVANEARALEQEAIAKENEAEALAQARLARSRQLAAEAANQMEDDPPLALLLAIESREIRETDESDLVLAALPYFLPPEAVVLTDHDAPITSLAWSPDGSLFASAGQEGGVAIWDSTTKRIVKRLGLLPEPMGADPAEGVPVFKPRPGLVWSPDGGRIATSTGSFDGVITIWDIESGEPEDAVLDVGGEDDMLQSLTWSGERLGAVVSGWHTAVWNTTTGAVVAELEGHLVGLAAGSEIAAAALSPDGSLLATSGDDRQIIIWDTETYEPILSLAGQHTSSVTSIAWSPDGSQLASASGRHSQAGDNTVVVWDLVPGEGSKTIYARESVEVPLGRAVTTLRDHTGGVNSVAWSRDGELIASGGADRTVMLWRAADGELLARLSGHTRAVNSVGFSPDGSQLLSAGDDHFIIVWDITPDQLTRTLHGHSADLTSLEWSPDGTRLASGSGDTSVVIWDVSGGRATKTISGFRMPVEVLAWHPGGSTLATATSDRAHYGASVTWDITRERDSELGALTDLTWFSDHDGCGAVAWSPDGSVLAVATTVGVELQDFHTDAWMEPIGSYEDGCVVAMDFSPDGALLALGWSSGEVSVWETADALRWNTFDPESATVLDGTVGWVHDLSWSPDGSRLAVAAAEQTSVWRRDAEAPTLTVGGYGSVDWSHDGTRLVTLGDGDTVAVWDAESGDRVASLLGHPSGVACAAVSPDGSQLATGGTDGRIRIVSTRFMAPPCTWTLRNMSSEEWGAYFPGERYEQTCVLTAS